MQVGRSVVGNCWRKVDICGEVGARPGGKVLECGGSNGVFGEVVGVELCFSLFL